MINIGLELRKAINTGKVYFGIEQARKAIEKGEAKLLIVAQNCPDEDLRKKRVDVPVHIYRGNQMELGTTCGKPFGVSVVTIVDPGESRIMVLKE